MWSCTHFPFPLLSLSRFEPTKSFLSCNHGANLHHHHSISFCPFLASTREMAGHADLGLVPCNLYFFSFSFSPYFNRITTKPSPWPLQHMCLSLGRLALDPCNPFVHLCLESWRGRHAKSWHIIVNLSSFSLRSLHSLNGWTHPEPVLTPFPVFLILHRPW
jgi:hypothetical protein